MPNSVQTGQWILVELGNNHNKSYRLTRYDDHSVRAEWGRVGDTGQTQTKFFTDEAAAVRHYESTVRSKLKKGYTEAKTLEGTASAAPQQIAQESLKEVAVQQIRTTSPLVRDLVAKLAQANVHNILSQTTMHYDTSRGTFSTPLGIVTSEAIREARDLLTQIGNCVAVGRFDNSLLPGTVDGYLRLIPQNIGRRRLTPRDLFPDPGAVMKQNALLDSLEASLQMVLTAPKAGQPEAPPLFNVSLEIVEDGREIDRIRRKFRETAQSMHQSARLDVQCVYLIEIEAMRKAFAGHGAKLPNVWELWHGSLPGNWLSIFKNGFVIPPSNAAHCTGRLFGNGVYFSDQSTKSANYSFGFWSGGQSHPVCYTSLNNVAMGRYYTPASKNESLPKPGYDSTFAIGGKSGVINNEMVVYRCDAVDPVFLVQLTPGGK